MKVSDLIKVLEEHKDKDFYHLNMGNPVEIQKIKTHIVGDALFLEINGKHDFRYISEMENLDYGFTPRLRTEQEMDLYRKQQIIESREFEYQFAVGEEVMLDDEIMFDILKEKVQYLIGLKGIVKKCVPGLKTYREGTNYAHVVEWEDGTITQDTDFRGEENVEYDEDTYMPKNYLSSIYLKKAE